MGLNTLSQRSIISNVFTFLNDATNHNFIHWNFNIKKYAKSCTKDGGNVGVEGLGKLIMFVAIIYCIVYYTTVMSHDF